MYIHVYKYINTYFCMQPVITSRSTVGQHCVGEPNNVCQTVGLSVSHDWFNFFPHTVNN